MFDGVMIYFWWSIQKERNIRTFQNKSLQPREAAILCKEEVEQYRLATRSYGQTNQSQQQQTRLFSSNLFSFCSTKWCLFVCVFQFEQCTDQAGLRVKVVASIGSFLQFCTNIFFFYFPCLIKIWQKPLPPFEKKQAAADHSGVS